VLTRKGGRGVVREMIELVLRARGDWDRVVAPFFT
jgi:3-deoxy-D-manno-octulosonate 8-phosphate phosphatase KdsC-like HAD superfamily phosphatase